MHVLTNVSVTIFQGKAIYIAIYYHISYTKVIQMAFHNKYEKKEKTMITPKKKKTHKKKKPATKLYELYKLYKTNVRYYNY